MTPAQYFFDPYIPTKRPIRSIYLQSNDQKGFKHDLGNGVTWWFLSKFLYCLVSCVSSFFTFTNQISKISLECANLMQLQWVVQADLAAAISVE